MAEITYSHRNGETEPPTEPGLYWFKGGKAKHRRSLVRQCLLSVWDGGEQRGLRARGDAMSPDNLDQYMGCWWGPVTPPWEENTNG